VNAPEKIELPDLQSSTDDRQFAIDRVGIRGIRYDLAERSASCELYGLLKRLDEKYVTERAYENRKFVEDMVRDIAGVPQRDPRVRAYRVESENFESIHNHSAYACIARGKPQWEGANTYAI
jgi:GTP cyclohydrolase FolE2